ncbi:hypothetical protein HYS96_01795 [Candidatus Daviesbacteria bacterium]|nr:hypothetical protein [Candidatus Daviesbacteria bacterium]
MTLTQTAILSRQIIVLTAVALILGILGFIGYKIWYAYYLSTIPRVEEKPDTKFGFLPYPDFPTAAVSSSNFSYSLDTKTGGLPKVGQDTGFEKIIKVYFIVKSFATLLSPERSEDLAKKFAILTSPQILSETQYKFKENGKSLLVDLDTGNFSYTKEATISGAENLDDDNKLLSDFERFLESLGYLNGDLREGRTKITLLKKDGEKLISTTLRSEAIAAQVSIWPKAIDGKSIFTPNFNEALVKATVLGSAANLGNYLSANFTYYVLDNTTFATYLTKSAEQAFEDLKGGGGVVVLEPDKPQVSITSVYLGYYLSQNYSPYLQPIFVFEGPNFVAYVPAVSSEYLNP